MECVMPESLWAECVNVLVLDRSSFLHLLLFFGRVCVAAHGVVNCGLVQK